MKIVIDIDESLYTRIRTYDYSLANDDEKTKDTIRDGTLYEERPQGKWITTSPYNIEGKCSLCCYLSNKCYNYCPNCGAYMRKGSKNENNN